MEEKYKNLNKKNVVLTKNNLDATFDKIKKELKNSVSPSVLLGQYFPIIIYRNKENEEDLIFVSPYK